MAHQFDEAVKAMAASSDESEHKLSRRELLGLIGGGVAGLFLASIGIESASAAKNNTKTRCGRYCREAYDKPKNSNARAKQRKRRCEQMCEQCGGPEQTCTDDGIGTGTEFCCIGGFCTERNPGCSNPAICGTTSEGNVNCACVDTIEGATACIEMEGNCPDFETCESSADCNSGEVCAPNCCTEPRCFPFCADPGNIPVE